VVIAQHVAVFRIGTTLARAMVRPYFSFLLHTQSDFGHSGPLCVHVLSCKLALLESDLPPKAGLSRESQRVHPRVHKTF
jgi:hypothetical protein